VEVPILKQQHYLIATVQAALTDADLTYLRDTLVERVGKFRSHAVIVRCDRLGCDGFLRIPDASRPCVHDPVRGAETAIVGIQPEVAFAMVQLGLNLEGVATALDLEEGLAFLNHKGKSRGPGSNFSRN
jgi:rsbT antagonist protein RsbS